MHFTQISLVNFGQFNGSHTINLSPDNTNASVSSKPIILVGGKNGAGKTTLLEAVKLCLYGSTFLGVGVKRQAYEEYLARRIHRKLGAPIGNVFAEVGVTFVHTIEGQSQTYQVRRMWQRTAKKVEETLRVLRDGVALSPEEQEWWDKFLHDLLPPGLADLFFFDGEKIQALADDPDYSSLKEAINSLLGLDLLNQLRADLGMYLTRQRGKGQPSLEEELGVIKQERAAIEQDFASAFTALSTTTRQINQKQARIEEEERTLASEGGKVAERRAELKQRAAALKEDITRKQRDLTELANGLFPFAVIPLLCQDLQNRLITEEQIQQQQMMDKFADNLLQTFIDKVTKNNNSWLDTLTLPAEEKSKVVAELVTAAEKSKEELVVANGTTNTELLHDLSKHDRQELFTWLEQINTSLPEVISKLGAAIELDVSELANIEATLLNMPADETIKPILQNLAQLHEEMNNLKAQKTTQETVVQQLYNKRAEVERKEQSVYTRMMRGDDPSQRVRLVEGVQRALARYEETLRAAKIEELEKRIAECFGRLSRKGNYIKRVSIDPRTFETTLFNLKDDPLPKEDLSAGEKQIYAVALLWALRLVSGRSLPIIVDTPLGRLDSDHRELLVERYFPQASHQVVLLSTDTEIDKELFENISPAVSRTYTLAYQPSQASTEVEEGYFWQASSIESGEQETVVA